MRPHKRTADKGRCRSYQYHRMQQKPLGISNQTHGIGYEHNRYNGHDNSYPEKYKTNKFQIVIDQLDKVFLIGNIFDIRIGAAQCLVDTRQFGRIGIITVEFHLERRTQRIVSQQIFGILAQLHIQLFQGIGLGYILYLTGVRSSREPLLQSLYLSVGNILVENDGETHISTHIYSQLGCHNSQESYNAQQKKHQRRTDCRRESSAEKRVMFLLFRFRHFSISLFTGISLVSNETIPQSTSFYKNQDDFTLNFKQINK